MELVEPTSVFTRDALIRVLAEKIANLQRRADIAYYKDNPPKEGENTHACWLLDQVMPLKELCRSLGIIGSVYEEAYRIYDFRNSGRKGYELRDGIIQKVLSPDDEASEDDKRILNTSYTGTIINQFDSRIPGSKLNLDVNQFIKDGTDIEIPAVDFNPLITGFNRVVFESELLTEKEAHILSALPIAISPKLESIEITYYVCKETYDLLCKKILDSDFAKALIIKYEMMYPTGQVFDTVEYTNLQCDTKKPYLVDFVSGQHDIMKITVRYSKVRC